MKKSLFSAIIQALIIALMPFTAVNVMAQLTVSTTQTPVQLVQNVLVGTGVTVSNVTYSGAAGARGHFITGATPTNLGLSAGVILSSGLVNGNPAIGSAVFNFANNDNGYGADADLDNLTADGVEDAAVLSFDFIPVSDTIKFRYVFASEEYPDYVNSSVNDVFGFFVSGPNPAGSAYNHKNIALIPGTNLPVTIDNINAGSYSQYYIDNEGINGTTIVYNGFTTIFTAWCLVVPCQQYHLKIAIGDAGDAIYDSGVFLEANSFSSTAVSITQFPSVPNVGNNSIEGCNDVTVHFALPQASAFNYPIAYSISGTAINGTDYTTISNSLMIPAGQTSADLIIHPLTDAITEGTETIVLTVQTSICGSTTDVIINISDNTPLVIQASNDTTTICNAPVTLWANASGGISPYAYSWSNNLGTGTSVSVNPAGLTTYTVSVSDVCGNTVSEPITVSTLPGMAEAGNDDTICSGQSTTLTGSLGTTYLWSTGATTAAITVAPATTTTYYLTATNGCQGYDSVTVFVNPLPVLTATASPATIHMSDVVNLTATGATDYSWNASPNDLSMVGQQNSASPIVTPGITTDYTVIGTDDNGCTGWASVTVSVIPVLPEVNFYALPEHGCEPLVVQFRDSSMKTGPATMYLWDFGNGTSSTDKDPLAFYPDNGTYDVSLTVTNPPNLSATLTIPGLIIVYPTPYASFITLPNREVSILESTIGFFDSTISDPQKWVWTFGDGDSSRLANVYHTYADTGTYHVSLIASNSYGCSDTAYTDIRVRPEAVLFAPSAFTPNGDGKNDLFYVQGSSIKEGSYIIRIFSRWGQEIFFSTDPEYPWDGTDSDGKIQLGTYVYLIEYMDLEGHTMNKKGTVTLFH